MTVEHDGLSADQRQGQAGRRHRPQLRLQAGQGGRRRLEGVPGRRRGLQRRRLRAAAQTVRGGDRAVARRCRALHVNLALAYFRLKRPTEAVAQPREGGGAGAERRRASSIQLGSAYVDMQAYDKAVAALEKGLARQARSGHGSAGASEAAVDAGRGLLRPGQGRRGRGAVPEGARRQARAPPARRSAWPRSTSARATSQKALELFDQVVADAPGHARSRAGGDVHQRAPQGHIVKEGHCDQAHRRRVPRHSRSCSPRRASPRRRAGATRPGRTIWWPAGRRTTAAKATSSARPAGIWAESPDRVYIFSRGCLPALKETRGAADSFIPSPQRLGLRHVAEGSGAPPAMGSRRSTSSIATAS